MAKVSKAAATGWAIFCGFTIFLGAVVAWPDLVKIFSSDKENFEAETVIVGELKPQKLSDNRQYSVLESVPEYLFDKLKKVEVYPHVKGIWIKNFSKKEDLAIFLDGKLLRVIKNDLYRGIDLFNPLFDSCIASHFYMVVKDEKLYISLEFKDLKNEETIGIIDFNHWRLFKENLLSFESTDEKLEVRDKQNNIVLAIRFQDSYQGFFGILNISGYFIGSTSILVIPNVGRGLNGKDNLPDFSYNCISKAVPDWKNEALKKIEFIETIFPKDKQ